MKNLLAYTPETFDNLELENFEYAPLAGEMDMEEGEAWKRRQAVGRTPRRFPPVTRKARMIKPIRPKVRLGYPLVPHSGAVNVFPPADDRRPSGQFSSSGNAGGEGSFANAPAQDVSSEHVRWVQETLNRALGLRLIVDGIMNRETRSAVRMFQERKGLPVTGLVGPDTEEALRAEGGQAAAVPELLEGDWEMPDSGECSCCGREMEEFGELEGEAAPRVLTYTTKDVIDNRISVPAQHSLVRLSKKQATSADAVGMLEAVKSGRLLGIWCVNWKAPSDRAQQHGSTWGDVIPKGEDAVLMLDPVSPLAGAPLIAFRRTLDTRPEKGGCGMLPKETAQSYFPQRLDAALVRAWQSFTLWQQRQIGRCTQPAAMPVSNLIPNSFCRVSIKSDRTGVKIHINAPVSQILSELSENINEEHIISTFDSDILQPQQEIQVDNYVLAASKTTDAKAVPNTPLVTYTWTSSDPYIVEVRGNGPNVKIIGKQAGYATIEVVARDKDGVTKDVATVTVVDIELRDAQCSPIVPVVFSAGSTQELKRSRSQQIAYRMVQAKLEPVTFWNSCGLNNITWTFNYHHRLKGRMPRGRFHLETYNEYKKQKNNQSIRTTCNNGTVLIWVNMPPHGFNKGTLSVNAGFGLTREINFEVYGVVVLDPGHGNDGTLNKSNCYIPDTGCSHRNNATSATGVLENVMTWDMARLVEASLKSSGRRINVYFTREKNKNPNEYERAGIAQQYCADVFLSIHFNGSDDKTTRRPEVFYRNTSSIGNNYNINEDKKLGENIYRAVSSALNKFIRTPNQMLRHVKPDGGPPDRHGRRPKQYAVLREDKVGINLGFGNTSYFHPVRGVLCEIEFITHPDIDNLFNGPQKDAVRNAVAQNIAEAIIADIEAQP